MEPESSQIFRRETPEQEPAPAQSEDQSRERVSACDPIVYLEGLDQKKDDLHKIFDQIQEKASPVLEFALKWEEIDELCSSMEDSLKQRAMETELEEKMLKERFLELEKKEERLKLVEEREMKVKLIEASIIERLQEKAKDPDLKLFVEPFVMRLVSELQNEEVVTQFNAQKKLLSSMMKKHEEEMRELEARREEIALLSKSIDDKSCDLEMKVKDFDLKQREETERRRKETELMDISLKQLEGTKLEKKEEDFQLKQEAEARETEVKRNYLELKEKQLEDWEKELELKQSELVERTIRAETRKRSRLESGPSSLAERVSKAASLIPPEKKHKPITEHNHDDENKEKDLAFIVPDFTSSIVQISEAHEGEFKEADSIDGIDEYPEPLLMCVDSEFNDFSKTMHSFKAGQVWALYDGIDSMPRLYGRIKKVTHSRSSIHVTWFEPKDKESEPVACGRFKWGITETIKNHLTFSHVMHPIIHGRNFIAVIPRKGETWALFRDWSKSWNTNPEQHKLPYRYDFVEVLRNFDDCLGFGVAFLEKVEGFVSVYRQAGQHGLVLVMVPPEEMRRFSHRVPSVIMNGKEKAGIPAGSFELDPAALPGSILKRDHSIRKEVTETESQSKDCGQTGEFEGQDGSGKEVPIILD